MSVLPVLSGVLWLPRGYRNWGIASLKEQFSVEVYDIAAKEPENQKVLVEGFVEEEGWIGIPRQAGLKLISEFDDQRSPGKKIDVPRRPALWSEQKPFVEEMLAAARAPFPDFMAYAGTGKGKTVCSLYVAAEVGVTFVVIVDQERLMAQWIKRAQEHLGFDSKLTVDEILAGNGKDIGIVRGPRSLFKGRKMVVAMVQSLSQRQYSKEFYEWPGLVIFDEAHVAGAPVFSRALALFSAKIRFGVSATPDRRDALKKLLKWNLGEIEAVSESKHKASRVYYLESEAVISWYANKAKMSGRYLAELSGDAERNRLLSDAILWLYETGRDVLVVSDRIEQLCNLMALCEARGMPEKAMGLYSRYREVWKYQKNPNPAKRPKDDETPMHYASIRVRVTPAELQEVIDSRKVIFATYAMFEKGVDVPRLSAGIDCTPRATAVQVHGRILRTGADKKTPIWVTVRDVYSFRAEYQFSSRLADYQKSNAEVYLWNPSKGVKKQDVDELLSKVRAAIPRLKSLRTETRLDGSYTLPIQHTRSASANLPAPRTARISRASRAV